MRVSERLDPLAGIFQALHSDSHFRIMGIGRTA